MRCKYRYALVILLAGICGFAQAGDLELYISKEAIELDYIKDIRLMDMEENKLSLGIFFDEDRDIIVNTELMMPGLLKGKLPIPLSFSFGAKAYVALVNEPRDEDVFAIAPGVGARLDIPIDVGMPMYVDAVYFYAPEILTFGGADKGVDFTARFEVDFLPRLTTFIGYRKLRFDLVDTGRRNFDDSFHVGMRYRF